MMKSIAKSTTKDGLKKTNLVLTGNDQLKEYISQSACFPVI